MTYIEDGSLGNAFHRKENNLNHLDKIDMVNNFANRVIKALDSIDKDQLSQEHLLDARQDPPYRQIGSEQIGQIFSELIDLIKTMLLSHGS
jgi:hypothetical protein